MIPGMKGHSPVEIKPMSSLKRRSGTVLSLYKDGAKLLNDDQKMWRMQVCQDILKNFYSNPDFLKKVITGDGTWVFEYDPETKCQSLQWKSPQSPQIKKARQ